MLVDGVVADVLGDGLALLVEHVAEDDLRALFDEHPHLGLTLAACPTGDDRHLAVELAHLVSPSFRPDADRHTITES